MLRGVSGFSVFTSRGSVFISSATNKKSLINAKVLLIHSFRIQTRCKKWLSWGLYEYKFFSLNLQPVIIDLALFSTVFLGP